MNRKYIKGIALLGLIASIMLPSCQLVNKYKTPEIDTENMFRDQTSSDTTTIANIPWRQYFNDPILQGLIEEALTNNFDMQIAETRIKQAEASLGMARAAYFPSVALVGNFDQTRLSANDPLTGAPRDRNSLAYHKESYTLGISASWELDIWGKINRQHRASRAQLMATQAGKNLVQTSLIANIATTYYSLLALDEKMSTTLAMIELLKESTNTMEKLMQSGSSGITGAAVEQSKAQLYSTQVTVNTLKSSIQELENALSTMLGRKPGPIFRSQFTSQQVVTQLNYGVPAQMLAKRPDVQQAELAFRSAFELKVAAQASFYPQITLTSGLLGYSQTNGLAQFFKPENLFASIVGGLTQPLFAKNQLLGQLKTRKAQEEEALLTFQKTVLGASQEVSTILYSYQQSLAKNETRAKQVESLEKTVDYTQRLLNSGFANSYLEVITAQQGLLQAQLDQISDKLEQLQYGVNLYRALGGGLE